MAGLVGVKQDRNQSLETASLRSIFDVVLIKDGDSTLKATDQC
jgi:ribosomal protein L30/L7E